MPSLVRRSFVLAALLAGALAACGPGEPPKSPERITHVTLAPAARRDLPLTESAVGAETALGAALGYDPSRLAARTLYVRLPFPEQVANRLHIGQSVLLTSFAENGRAVAGRIREIRPALNATTLSRDVIVAVTDARWRPSGSVRGEVTVGMRKNAVVVPEQAVVRRPAGAVVYAVEGETARERRVKTGIAREGVIEIIEGLAGDETVVVDGAGLLTDGARIKPRATTP
jgi:hypothetical protein